MSNVKVGDFCTHIQLGGLMHVESDSGQGSPQNPIWRLRAISSIECIHSVIETTGGMVIHKAGPVVAHSGQLLACSDCTLRRVNPPEEDKDLAETEKLSNSLQILRDNYKPAFERLAKKLWG